MGSCERRQMARKRNTMKNNKTAKWNGTRYVCGEWSSRDGNAWELNDGTPATGKDFQVATILLVGGPLDGEVVY